MRRLVVFPVLMVCGWTVWWFFAAQRIENGVVLWLEARRAEGWQAEVSELAISGYPFDLSITFQGPEFADPDTGIAVAFPSLLFSARAYWPGHAQLLLPAQPIIVASPFGRSFWTTQDGTAHLRLHPGTALELEQMTFNAAQWDLARDDGPIIAAGPSELSLKQDEDADSSYAIGLNIDTLTPGDAWRKNLGLPQEWPHAFEKFALTANVQFDRSWDLRALEVSRPQPRQIDLELAEVRWGDMSLKSAGSMSVDEAGYPTGQLSFQAENWKALLELAEVAGLIPTSLRPQAEQGLSLLAGLSGNPDTIDIRLNFGNQMMAVGFIPIGPAPRIVLR